MKEHYSNIRDELALEARLRTAKVRLRAGFSAMRRHPARIAASVLYFALLLLFLRNCPLLLPGSAGGKAHRAAHLDLRPASGPGPVSSIGNAQHNAPPRKGAVP